MGAQWRRVLPTLIFSVSPLDFLVYPLLYLPLQYSCPCGLIILGDFEDMGSIDVVVVPPAHHMFAIDIELEHGYLWMYNISSGRLVDFSA